MQPNSTKYKWIIVGLTAALLIVLFFFTCNKKSEEKKKYIPVVSIIENKVKFDSTQYHKSIDSLQAIEANLYKKVYESKNDLKTAQQLVVELLNQPPEFTDTSKLLSQIEILKSANATKDSICNSTISALDSLVLEKESKYQVSLDFQSKQRASISELINSNKEADNQIKSLTKQVKKQKANKVLYKIIAGVAIVYGVSKSL